jgi:hypothetical protein
MKKTFIIVSLLAFLLLGSCITKERCERFYPPQVSKTDTLTTTTHEYLHDTLLLAGADSSMLEQLLECDKNGQITLKELQGYKAGIIARIPQLSIKNNVLTVDCHCDSVKIHAILKDRETRIVEKHSVTIVPPAVQVKFIPGWMWGFGIIGMVVLGVAVIYFGGGFLLKKLKLFI